MITWKSLYHVLSNVIPLYVAMILAYSSVKWWKLFSPSECVGINRFVVLFAVPLLSIKYISENNPYTMNFIFIAADTLQKVIVIVVLFLWYKLSSRGSFDWCITLFSLTTLNNTIVMGIPLLGGMYGDTPSESLMVQLSVIQFIVWYPGLLLLFECRRATRLCLIDDRGKCCRETEAIVGGDDDDDGNLGFDDDDEKNDVVVEIIDQPNDELEGNSDETQSGDDKKLANDDDDQDHDRDRNRNRDHNDRRGKAKASSVQPIETATLKEPKSRDKLAEGVTSKVILIMVCKKLMRNPNFYSSAIALIWSLISFRYHIEMPTIVTNSIKILADAGIGMAMFCLGLFMASQPKIIAGGVAAAVLSTLARFVVSPAIITATSTAVGLRGTVLAITIMQAALPQAIIPFVYAREYNVHPGILSTAVSFGMLISLPITIGYYIVLGLIIK